MCVLQWFIDNDDDDDDDDNEWAVARSGCNNFRFTSPDRWPAQWLRPSSATSCGAAAADRLVCLRWTVYRLDSDHTAAGPDYVSSHVLSSTSAPYTHLMQPADLLFAICLTNLGLLHLQALITSQPQGSAARSDRLKPAQMYRDGKAHV